MLVIDTDHPDGLLVRRATSWLDVAAAKIVEDDRFLGSRPTEPPTWTYWIIGGHPRYSLGGLLWHLGHGAMRRFYNLPTEQLEA